ncbi:MAG: helix-turn-helix domain-containing protein [Candidatus Bathyarchaeia archaeon]
MEREDVLSPLMTLGLSLYEAKVYAALVQHGPKTGSELSLLSGVPRSKIYGSLKTLCRKNLLRVLPTKPLRFEAYSPVKLRPILERIESEAQRCVKAIDLLTLKYEGLKHTRRVSYSGEVEALEIRGRRENLAHLNSVFENASNTVRLILTRNALVRVYKACMETLSAARARDVKITAITPKNVPRRLVEEIQDTVQLRLRETTPPGVSAYVDSREALYIQAVPDDVRVDKGEDIGVWILHPQVVSIEEFLFDALFQEGL